jgi:hypothetical protein
MKTRKILYHDAFPSIRHEMPIEIIGLLYDQSIIDTSYKNDMCPSFMLTNTPESVIDNDEAIRIWVHPIDISAREDESCIHRFYIYDYQNNNEVLSTDSIDDVVKWVVDNINYYSQLSRTSRAWLARMIARYNNKHKVEFDNGTKVRLTDDTMHGIYGDGVIVYKCSYGDISYRVKFSNGDSVDFESTKLTKLN